jgi:hypothetical protein
MMESLLRASNKIVIVLAYMHKDILSIGCAIISGEPCVNVLHDPFQLVRIR